MERIGLKLECDVLDDLEVPGPHGVLSNLLSGFLRRLKSTVEKIKGGPPAKNLDSYFGSLLRL
jgi:hypothetical protein